MDTESTLVLLYIPCPTPDIAQQLARLGVEKNLAFCGQVLPGITSIYKWQGSLNQDDEVILILKTDSRLEPTLTQLILANHPYEIPCVLKLPAESLNPAYTKWALEPR